LLDVQMHGLDGFETAKQIRSREKSRHTPIIFITAYESDHFPVEQAYSLGAVDYLVKPLVPAILRAKVSGFVELYQNSMRLRQLERREFERRLAEDNSRVDRRRNARLRVTQLLAEATSLPDAAYRILESLCQSLEWDAGALWQVDTDSDVLRCVEFWHRSGVNVPEFEG